MQTLRINEKKETASIRRRKSALLVFLYVCEWAGAHTKISRFSSYGCFLKGKAGKSAKHYKPTTFSAHTYTHQKGKFGERKRKAQKKIWKKPPTGKKSKNMLNKEQIKTNWSLWECCEMSTNNDDKKNTDLEENQNKNVYREVLSNKHWSMCVVGMSVRWMQKKNYKKRTQ